MNLRVIFIAALCLWLSQFTEIAFAEFQENQLPSNRHGERTLNPKGYDLPKPKQVTHRRPGKHALTLKEHGVPETIPGRHIITMKNSSSTLKMNAAHDFISNLVDKDINSSIDHKFTISGMRGNAGHFSYSTLEQIKQHPEVAFIEADQVVYSAGLTYQESPPSWGLERIDQLNLPLKNSYAFDNLGGEGVDVYVVDTGIYWDHSQFQGRARLGHNFRTGETDTDCNGHGTHVAGTIGAFQYGVAKRANLWAVKVLNCQGTGRMSDVIAGINWAVSNHKTRGKNISVINLSLSGSISQAVNNAIDAATAANVVVVVAAGNNYANACSSSPASAETAVAVGAITSTDSLAYFSDHGPCVDIFAPGVDIVSLGITGPTSTATKSGTSMASPHVAGTVALWAAHATKSTTASTYKWLIQNRGTKNLMSNVPSDGTVNAILYTSPPLESIPVTYMNPSSISIPAN